MKSSLRRLVLVAVVGLSVLALAQTPAHAQFFYRSPVLPYRPFVRYPVVAPSVGFYANSYAFPGMTYSQFASVNVVGGLPPWMYSYYNPYLVGSPFVNPYLTTPFPVTTYTTRVTVPGVPLSPFNVYNPYFAAFGLFP